MKGGLMIVVLLCCSTAFAEKPAPEDVDRAVIGVLAEWEGETRLKLCYDQARLMMFGAYQKEKGRPIEAFVESGALPKDSSEYKFVLDGYSMSGFMDDASKTYFLECAKPVLRGAQ